jgi:protein ImuA
MLQTRHAPRADTVAPAPGVDLARARAHEATGPARQVFALFVAGAMTGPVLWLQSRWAAERLMGDGIRGFLDPGQLVFGEARTPQELLWAAEEALRTGLMPLVVVDLPEPPGLTPVRRLHLAAEAGAERGTAPLALLLTPDRGGAPGTETRWRMAARPGWAGDGKPRWELTRARSRMVPEETREMRLESGRLRPVPPR